ncbi:hypothetical protein CEXT_198311 [Caerostris extrusa]|uniref:Uncharacterized protein n=1 Tax=Caerostris extrusa TaxID=172846 RepID=A0AAV4MCC4_CAEEX|nr:hypothetical protein CEXT_198311 [Caerostris extrusa]
MHLRKAKAVKLRTEEPLFRPRSRNSEEELRQSGRISRFRNPLVCLSGLVVPFLLPDCCDLIKLLVFSLHSGGRLEDSSIAREKTNLARSS